MEKVPLGKNGGKYEDNIEKFLGSYSMRAWAGFTWLMNGSSFQPLQSRLKISLSIKQITS